MRIRDGDPEGDGAACAAIYAPAVAAATSFEEQAPDGAQMGARIAAVRELLPWLVAEHDDAVVGYAYAGRHRERPAYRWAAEVSVYVDGAHHRRGIGRALYDALLGRIAAQGYRVALAGITLPNPASVALHESLGFAPVGVYRAIGFKAGAWRDVGWWQKHLPEGPGTGSAAEPAGPWRPGERGA
jgi:L-amino acid N-acyltransferase YncA